MATDVNKVILIGRLTRTVGEDEQSFGYVGNGTARANLSLAVNRSRKDSSGQWVEEVSYINVTVWGKTAENLKDYLQKGTQVAVVGYLKQDRWEKDGQKRSQLSVVAENIQLLGGKKSSNNDSNSVGNEITPNKASGRNGSDSRGISDQNFDGQADGYPEDIPF